MAVVGSNAPLPETKPTRQWDAWTREEEENFFGALRQVGKNFEKITSRVQSKNKDQVRHYYYRVIKRMNRILAPTLILDARNSTYVNSAMLRWWSLLEKHSCSASKLRLKPRRFKTFVTALEHQLLKDHKKVKTKKPASVAVTSRKHASHADTSASGLPDLVPSESGGTKASAEDLQGPQTASSGRRTAVKRKAASGAPRKSASIGEAKRPPRPRKKATDGNPSKAAYTKWEKAASVGVSLMAEAAEQLERASAAQLILPASEASDIHRTATAGGNVVNVDVQTGQIPPGTSVAFSELGLTDKMSKELPSGLPAGETHKTGGALVSSGLRDTTCGPQTASCRSAVPVAAPSFEGALPNVCKGVAGGLVIIPELCPQVQAKSFPSDATRCNNCSTSRCNGPEEVKNDVTNAKLKLQLFPFDDFIRKALEQDGHNPHLELTFKARKSISSVLHHLVQKWGRSTVALGELRLFPFNTQRSNASACQSWGCQDLNISAADVHAALGNPAVFRLRYAWLSTRVLESSSAVSQQQQIHVSKEPGPVLSEGAAYPATASNSVTQQKSVFPCASASPASCVGTSISASAEQLFNQIQSLPVSEGACQKEDARIIVQHGVPVHTSLAVDVPAVVPSVEPMQKSSLGPVPESEHPVGGKLSCSDEAPAVTEELQTDKDFVQPELDLASFPDAEAANVDRLNCKEHESASQVSGCAWLYESNDGFAQQLWNIEDTLRSSNGLSMAQMDWVDSLTNASVSELLGEASRAVFSAPLDCLNPCSGQTQLTCLDSFDISIAGQELPLPGPTLMPIGHSSAAIWDGEDTCDAFSFQRLDRCSKETVNTLGEETSANSLGLDVTFADFLGVACWREGDSLVAQHCQNQDLLFGGDASVGLGGLIEALAQGSLDEFQACSVNDNANEGDIDQALSQGLEAGEQARGENGDVCAELPIKEGAGRGTSAKLCEQGRIEQLLNVNSELNELYDRLPEAALPNISLPPQDVESRKDPTRKDPRPVNTRLQRKKELHPPQRSFKLPGQFSTVRSLKLQG